ncbi:hypothetical protein E1301_Tti008716 [Triplophysa tibetana]|uniref:Uncharacterized protein n=1 Tax=Triplophysa tibetana TaxID=1572043 RepID=A0A5A9NZV4_9TELE|nr:hypothetical protein E1301_Tti008716 [Triplophysa tibetana]
MVHLVKMCPTTNSLIHPEFTGNQFDWARGGIGAKRQLGRLTSIFRSVGGSGVCIDTVGGVTARMSSVSGCVPDVSEIAVGHMRSLAQSCPHTHTRAFPAQYSSTRIQLHRPITEKCRDPIVTLLLPTANDLIPSVDPAHCWILPLLRNSDNYIPFVVLHHIGMGLKGCPERTYLALLEEKKKQLIVSSNLKAGPLFITAAIGKLKRRSMRERQTSLDCNSYERNGEGAHGRARSRCGTRRAQQLVPPPSQPSPPTPPTPTPSLQSLPSPSPLASLKAHFRDDLKLFFPGTMRDASSAAAGRTEQSRSYRT